jgi:hypothetical protein
MVKFETIGNSFKIDVYSTLGLRLSLWWRWDLTQCTLGDTYQDFGGSCYLHAMTDRQWQSQQLQSEYVPDKKSSYAKKSNIYILPVTWNLSFIKYLLLFSCSKVKKWALIGAILILNLTGDLIRIFYTFPIFSKYLRSNMSRSWIFVALDRLRRKKYSFYS